MIEFETKMVVIQKREYGRNGVTYSQYRLNIPQKIIDVLRWNTSSNNEIEFVIKDGNLILKNVTKNRAKID